MARTRIDLVLTIAVASFIGLGAQTLVLNNANPNYEPYEYIKAEITDGTVGAQADATTPIANSIAEIKEQDGLFTIELTNGRYNEIYYTGFAYINLDNDEYVIARIMKDSIQEIPRSVDNNPRSILPIGTVVNEPVPDEVVEDLQNYSSVTADLDYYIDMRGDHKGGKLVNHRNPKDKASDAFVIVTLISTVILWNICVRIGLFPPIIPRKAKNEVD